MGSGYASGRARIDQLIWVSLTLFLFASPVGVWADDVASDPTGPRTDDWITVNKDYSSQRYVDLDEITPRNVEKLKEICEIQLNEPVYFNSGILKVGRTLYTTTFRGTYAFDAVTCRLRWRHVIHFTRLFGANSNRGVGYLDGKIFRGTADGHVIALDANTGQPLPAWPLNGVDAADPVKHEAFVSAPIAWQGKVFIGIVVSDNGIAGRLMAFDANTGNKLWSFNTTLGFPSGGGFWASYSLDPKSGEVFGPVANPYPDFNRGNPPDTGMTKFTNSVISVDAATGKLNWWYQVVPLDEHDWDLSPAPTLYRTSKGKHGRDMIALAGKSGRVYGIDRATQLLAFNTPATTVENDDAPLNGDWMRVCPGLQGGAMFTGTAYHPGTGTLYVGMNDHCAWYVKNNKIEGGGDVVKDWPAAVKRQAPKGWITAIDGNSGRVLWQYQAESQVLAGLVPTKSGLLFAGDTHGNLLVFKASDGTLLKSIDTGGALNSGLISYSVGDEQFVTAAIGGATENPSTVAGPLKVSIYGLHGPDKPNVVTLDRLEPEPSPGPDGTTIPVNAWLYIQNCAQCHLVSGAGISAPHIFRQSQLADPELLKQFLANVPPPMPRLYPGVLQENEVEMIAEALKTGIFNCGPNEPQSCLPPPKPSSGGTAAWKVIYSDLTSPRCLNCHPVASPNLPTYGWNPETNTKYPQDYPRQGDDRHPHYFAVLRGDVFPFKTVETNFTVYPGKGPPFERCLSCHGNQNDPVTGIPGTTNPEGQDPNAPFWAMAPAMMAWESTPGVPFTGPQLCAQLKDKKMNGNRELADILHHLQTEPLVLWSFNPGIRPNGEPRTTPPFSHDALIAAFNQWMAEGAPCPNN
jgi:alcohol dehydrogenase (cytochrome c)